ncbi:MAG: hypothetical protein HC856_08740 [Pseudanabaena sp. RU_4_16]|nr:hypothetical protein [Pseudanabaena sp. RU_4_16]
MAVTWKKDWQTAETQFNAAQLALKINKPEAALEAANKIPKITFWQNKVKLIVDDAKTQLARNSQPAIVNPSNISPAPTNSTPVDRSPTQVPDSTANVERQQPTFDPPPQPEHNPVVAPPPGRTWEDEPSSNQNNTNPNNDGGI